jgi:hypothetical protein
MSVLFGIDEVGRAHGSFPEDLRLEKSHRAGALHGQQYKIETDFSLSL